MEVQEKIENAEVLPNSREEQMQNDHDLVSFWCNEIRAAKKRERKWSKDARKCVRLYEGDDAKRYQFNILYSNTETISPALYNETPRPAVTRRYKDDNPIGKAASDVVQRTLEFLRDTSMDQYSSYDDLMKFSALSALVPGRGVVRFKFESTFVDDAEGNQRVAYETVCGEEVPWDRFTHGFAVVWNKVPWVAFDHYMTAEELRDNFNIESEEMKEIPFNFTPNQTEETLPEPENQNSNQTDSPRPKLCLVHEIWDRATREVLFVVDGYTVRPLKRVPDPLRLSGFFPMPKPLVLFAKLKTLTPTTLYKQYQEQAKELNEITLRINNIIGACKIRGVYDPRFTELERLLREANDEDNNLIPANTDSVSSSQDFPGYDKFIWLMPVDKIVSVLQTLIQQREAIKVVIYEIMGIADILRGSSKASETLGAQNIKAQWGSLRLKRMQKLVAQFCRDSFRVMAEIAVTHLGQETLAKMTGLQFPTDGEKEAANQAIAKAKQLQQEPDAQSVQVMNSPSWEQILDLLRNDLTRAYTIDIESNSTIDPEATEDQKNIAELMNAISQFLNGMGPMVDSGIMPFEAVKTFLLFVVRRFRAGPDIEEQIKAMRQPEKKDESAAQNQAEIQKLQLTAKIEEDKLAFERQNADRKFQLDKYEIDRKFELERHKMDLQARLDADRANATLNAEIRKTQMATSAKERVERQKIVDDSTRKQAAMVNDLITMMRNVLAAVRNSDPSQVLAKLNEGLSAMESVISPETKVLT